MVSKTDSVKTPDHILERLKRDFFKFETVYDPTPFNTEFDPKKNKCGLTSGWGSPSFCNPPYSCSYKFLLKANDEYMKHGVKSILLVKANLLCTKTFEKVYKNCHILFFKRRIKFVGYSHASRFSSVLIVFGYQKKGHFDMF